MGTVLTVTDKNLESLVEVTNALLRGEFDHKEAVVDAEGLLATLTRQINTMIVNMRLLETPLSSAGEQAPTAVQYAENVVTLMAQSTGEVLDKSDKVLGLAEEMEGLFQQSAGQDAPTCARAQEIMTSLKGSIFDIIASQSYQDVARQKMEVLINDLNRIRDWLMEALLILNIRKDDSPENIQKKAQMLKEVKESTEARPAESLKQDLVDDLLAEFGF
ncbi:MAG: hypothetical protein COZ12_07960 [Deltaproteobacteria bacterium CG_4_10_14_3_um_filter_60_8]|nr:MAG: hypothetical protein AUK28_01710 [Desulfobacterales bacterium CG2_30_60_27]PIP44484.1 MAG: hypothetical protein COX17_01125 [Deltaproteobacteria bacterium CG23_combo_of_CG06-09_8_20_14_all_60_8]PIY20828.1 MAG: hypothetical protein COZ12_07960 [Deltaproteobacteria bacterium CG_4_10_14_3_um_filter_60_8]